MSMTPAATSRNPWSLTRMPASRARLPGWQEIYTTRPAALAPTSARRPGSVEGRRRQVGSDVRDVGDSLPCSVANGSGHESRLALDTQHFAGATRQRQREIAEPAEQVEHGVPRFEREQFHRAADHPLVEFAIDLDEVGGLELEMQAERGECVSKGQRTRLQRPHRLGAARLQVEAHRVTGFEAAQQIEIGLGRSVEHAQHDRADAVGDRDLGLGHSRSDRKPGDQLRQRIDQHSRRRRENAAFVQVSDVGRRALAKSDQHPSLAWHQLYAEPCAPPIRPDRPCQRFEHTRGLDAAESDQVLQQLGLLESKLRRRSEVLQRAAAAEAEMRALGRHTVFAWSQHLLEHSLVEIASPPHAPQDHALTRQRIRDEHRLAVDLGDASTFV
jgi:hypothetical protein